MPVTVLLYVAHMWHFPSNPHGSLKLFYPLHLGQSVVGLFLFDLGVEVTILLMVLWMELELLLGKQATTEL